ncbi:MAG: glycosyltransferase family 2 protein [Bacteroidia bacterium]|nr:glycosyltransferase family 2 protein [Bacteroidia bacterium]
MAQPALNISILIPFLNEEESLPELIEWIERVMHENNFTYEILLIDDGSTDGSWKIVEALHANNAQVKAIKFRRNHGKSAALNVGFHSVQGDVVITMDADMQDSPDEIPELYRMIATDGYDLVSGWKKKRYDPITKTIPTKLFNAATRSISGIQLHDFNCGLKAYKQEVVKSIEVYNEMHRYIPVIAKWAGFKNIAEKVVQHRARKYGSTKFGGMSRFINGFLDLLTIFFVSKFGKRPMHFFGVFGTIMFFFGFVGALWIGIDKLVHVYHGDTLPRNITDQPMFFLSLVTGVIGVQLFLTGFIGEMISRNASERNVYGITKRIGLDD